MLTPRPGPDYIPPLRFHALTRLYDWLVSSVLPEKRIKTLLVSEAVRWAPRRVLDLGAGTGTLTMMLKHALPEGEIVGLDADASALERARKKAARAGAAIELLLGDARSPALPARSFDGVVSSLFLHHLDRAGKLEALRGARRLLRPGGHIAILDWGRPHGLGTRAAFLLVQLLDGFRTTADNAAGLVPSFMAEAGFVGVRETHRARTVLGSLSIYCAEVEGG